MIVNILVFVCFFALVVIWLFLPGEAPAAVRAPFWGMNHAHRGLHTKDRQIPENSLAAFTAAVDAGYGIELDIQLSRDGEVVVFHDDDLLRVCGTEGRVDSYTWEQLQAFRLHDTNQGIPLLWDVLDMVDGQVPLIIELKKGPNNRQLCESAWRILRTYDGDFCIESFDPRIVRWWKKNVPGVLRGQLAAPPSVLKAGPAGVLVGLGLSHFLGRPQFLAYHKGKQPLLVRLCMRFCMSVVWTATEDNESAELEMENDAVIFEGYLPEARYLDAPGMPPSWPDEDEPYRF